MARHWRHNSPHVAGAAALYSQTTTATARDALEREALALARPLLAQALLERSRRRADSDALAEARTIYSELGATRRLAHIGNPAGVMA